MAEETQIGSPEPQYEWQKSNPKPQFDVGRVLGRVVSVLRNNLIGFVGLAMLVIAIPFALISAWPVFMDLSGGIVGLETETDFLETINPAIWIVAVIGILGLIFGSVVLQGALIHACVKDFNDEASNVRQSIKTGIRYFWPLLGLYILAGLGVMAGFVALIIPGILLSLGWSIAAPILIIEDLPITKSLERSWQLSKGYKRWLLLIFVIVAVITGIISVVLTIPLYALGDPQNALITGASTLFFLLNGIISGIAQAITSLINSAVVASSYYEIRELKEGVGADKLAQVFD